LATLSAGSPAVAQPITTAPLVEIHPTSRKRFVMFGTGQLLDSIDISSAAEQSFYALIDGNTTSFRPADATMPITRAQLTQLTDLVNGVTLPNTSLGWYFDLGKTGATAWRMVQSASSNNGRVAFTPLLTVGDACSPSGQSRFYVVDYSTGQSALAVAGQTYVAYDHAITDQKFIRMGDGTVRSLVGTDRGELTSPPLKTGAGSALRMLNWREVPTVD
jgi:type IV pilus assembly protein PilY1